jgi:sugar O-acyltransferase (sialic acid O-acetyltransferase NeuD family)
MSGRLIILGTGGNAYDVLDTIDAVNRATPTWQVVGFLDDVAEPNSEYLERPVLGTLADAASHLDCRFVSAIWNDRVFRTLHEVLARTRLAADRFVTLIHPGAAVSTRARLGHDVVVQHGATIAGNVDLADHVWVGPGCIVGHGSALAGCSILAPGAVLGGGVRVERNCYVASGALVRPAVRLGEGSLVGMGAVVLADVAAGSTVVGSPARPLSKTRSRGD